MGKKTRILVVGGSGLIGLPLCNILKLKYDVFTTYHKNKYSSENLQINIQNIESVKNVFSKVNPEIVINLCGIYNNLKFCENNKELVMAVNSDGLKIISNISNQYNSYLISISSDFVFDGNKGNYNETDETNPINFYGRSRVCGERNIKELAKKYCLIRTSMIYGKNPLRKTLADLIYSNVLQGNSVELIKDQFMTPTYLENFCLMLSEIIEKQYEGIIHLAGADRISKYEFGKKLLNLMDISEDLLIPVTKDSFDFSKEFPNDSSLNTKKANSLLNNKPEKIESALKDYLIKMNSILK